MPDARVQSAIDHWAPRFIQAGMDYSDFLRTIAGVERWEDWLDAFAALGDFHATRAARGGGRGPRGHGERGLAPRRRRLPLRPLRLGPGRRPGARGGRQGRGRAVRSAHGGAERIEVPFEGSMIVGNLRRPEGVDDPPLVLLIPGLDSTKEEFWRLEGVFLSRGMAALSSTARARARAATSWPSAPTTRSRPAPCSTRSTGPATRHGRSPASRLGGYHAPRAAAFEPRIQAVAGISGAYNFGALWEHIPELTRETFIHKSHATDAEDGRRRALQLDLDGVLGRLEAPALFVTGMRDRLIPWESTKRQAEEAPRGEFVGLEDGNHVCANVPYIARPLVADWLREKLG